MDGAGLECERRQDHRLAVDRGVANLDGWTRLQPVGDRAHQPLLVQLRIVQPDDAPIVVDTDHDHPSRSVGESADVLDHAIEARQITLEIERLALGLLEEFV